MEQNSEYMQKLIQEYEKALKPLLRYLPWLEKSAGMTASTSYSGQDIGENSLPFPVYDGTLMSFVREASSSSLMDRNYPYIYTRNHIKTPLEERKAIERATLKEWDILKGILSRYVLEGRTKGVVWSQGVKERIFLMTLTKMKQILEFWDKPFDIG